MTGPLSAAVEAADAMREAARQAPRLDPARVIEWASTIAECLHGATAQDRSHDDSSPQEVIDGWLVNLRKRCDQWEEYYDNPHIETTEEIRVLEFADAHGVPPSWVRAHCDPRDLRSTAQFSAIQSDRIDEQTAGATQDDEMVEIG